MASGERLRLLFCDHLSIARGKYLSAGKIGDGASRFCQGTFALTYDKQMQPAPGGTMLEGLPDLEAVYKEADIRPGWEPHTKVVMADLYETNGNPLGLCGRSLLKRTVKEWQALGLTPKVGLELEAFAFQRDENGRLVPYHTPGAYVYSTGRLADPLRFTDAIWSKASEAGFPIDGFTTEYDSPQFEFTLTYDDAVKAVDDVFLFRLMAREIALDHGIILTFMPKPIPTLGGSGLHVNFSFNDKQGRNVVGDTAHLDKLSDLTKGCIAGLMHHHRGMAGLVAPTVNSYERLKPASLSGYWCNWGIDHRGVTTRLSTEGGKKARIEHRMGDAAANPYTLVATVLQAAKLGYTGKYELPAPETADCIERHDATVGVPDNLGEALKALAEDKKLVAAVGELLVGNHIGIKQGEIGIVAALEGDAVRDYYLYYV
ncbi:glutamine synthetase [Hypericibacter adhaerens]|jgi:glutamine synthetase|uniref:Glutamine synthetase n=1 Tax=Hypericibacter adhaerens TaxID=2602016 RepID=A0A5J6N244_9PROT|nr:glutamine synthetase family protein [Hypericibacter adhaerens]QEX23023.1 glutamine synthetase [Hypericibacter adhaerens]